jgi:hypothetical protein
MTVTPPDGQISPPDNTSSDAGGSRRARWLGVTVAVVAVIGILALAAVVWYIFFRPAGPPPVGTDAPVIPESWLFGPVAFALSLLLA